MQNSKHARERSGLQGGSGEGEGGTRKDEAKEEGREERQGGRDSIAPKGFRSLRGTTRAVSLAVFVPIAERNAAFVFVTQFARRKCRSGITEPDFSEWKIANSLIDQARVNEPTQRRAKSRQRQTGRDRRRRSIAERKSRKATRRVRYLSISARYRC
jgi:hypothetical protein